MERVQLTRVPIEVQELVAAVQDERHGAVVTFLGVVRSQARGKEVSRLDYFAYEPMALRTLDEIKRETEDQWPARIAVVHRLGRLEIGEASVAIAAASPHRADAFEACRSMIERIKVDVPIWKKEYYSDGAVWIDEPAAV